ncbi:MAG: ATP synthase subunit I [Candidatus Aminicenantaceae bacterium]
MSKQLPFTQDELKILKRIPREIILLSFVGACFASFLFNVVTGALLLAGGIFSAASFLWLKNSISKSFIHDNKKQMLKSILGSYLLRLLLIVAVFSFIIIFFSKKTIAFMVGFSAIVLVFLAEAIVALSRIKK